MNELLGWYGYEKVDSRDTQGLNLTHFASNNPAGNPTHPPNGVSPPSSAMEGSDGSEDMGSHHGLTDGTPSRIRDDSASPGAEGEMFLFYLFFFKSLLHNFCILRLFSNPY